MFSDRLFRLGVGLFVGVWMARYLGPEQFGLLNFATAFVAIFGAFAALGLQGITVRELVRDYDEAPRILGTVCILQLTGGILAFLLIVGVLSYLRPDDALSRSAVAIVGFTLIFQFRKSVSYWFESQVQSKYVVWMENGAFTLATATRIVLILISAPLIAFLWSMLAEVVLATAGLLAVYVKKVGNLTDWTFRFSRARDLVRDSWPLILSALAVVVYVRIDQVMLGQLAGDQAVGIYSAAARVSEVWYFIPTTVMASAFPAIAKIRVVDYESYDSRFQVLYELMVILALIIALVMTFASDLVIETLFGHLYIDAGSMLAIHIWAGVFVFLGVVSSRWLIAENLTRYSMYRTIIGCGANVLLNLLLIPKWGGVGAAAATLISYGFSTFSILLFPRTRSTGIAMLAAAYPKNTVKMFGQVL